MKSKIILTCLVFWILPIICFAEFGQRFSIEGYSLHIAATQLGNKIIISGDISDGGYHDNLIIYMSLSDDKGNYTNARAVIKNYKNSGKFRIKKNFRKGGYWTVTQVQISQ